MSSSLPIFLKLRSSYRDNSEPAHCGYRDHGTLRCARGAAPARSRHSVELRADAGTSVPAAAEASARSRRGDRRRLRLRFHLQPGLGNVETARSSLPPPGAFGAATTLTVEPWRPGGDPNEFRQSDVGISLCLSVIFFSGLDWLRGPATTEN
jgi:hypothetical protein